MIVQRTLKCRIKDSQQIVKVEKLCSETKKLYNFVNHDIRQGYIEARVVISQYDLNYDYNYKKD